MSIQVTIEDDSVAFGVVRIVNAVVANVIALSNKTDAEQLDIIKRDLHAAMRTSFPRHYLYSGGHHVAVMKANGEGLPSRLILIAEVEGEGESKSSFKILLDAMVSMREAFLKYAVEEEIPFESMIETLRGYLCGDVLNDAIMDLQVIKTSESGKYLTYRELLNKLMQLNAESLNSTVTVSSGCDANGNAEFFAVTDATMANDSSILAASDGVLEGNQLVLLFEEEAQDF